VLETARLTLRRLTPDDAPFMLALLNDEDFLRNVGDRGARTIDDTRTYILNGPMAMYDIYGHGLYLAVERNSGEAIGICGLLKRDSLDDVDIGFAFLPEARGQGYAVESAAAVLAYGRDVLGLARVVAIVRPDNAASIRVLEKIGMRPERRVQLSHTDHELMLFSSLGLTCGPSDS
jgi:RimJ/RimL family protein N-acetyltransferase